MSREFVVARVGELQDGEMKGVELEGLKILLTRLAGKFYAIGGECSHYGGPLAEGVLQGEEVTCPWHQARFLVKTGDQVEQGQTVIILESMKMQNELKAPRAGKIGTISVQTRQTVDKGTLLLNIQEASE